MKNNKSNIGNLLTTEESAKYSGLKMQSFRNLVSRHIGPKLDHKEGLRCYYHKKELDRWNMIRLKRAPLAKKKVSPKEMIKIAMTRGQREATLNKEDILDAHRRGIQKNSFTVHDSIDAIKKKAVITPPYTPNVIEDYPNAYEDLQRAMAKYHQAGIFSNKKVLISILNYSLFVLTNILNRLSELERKKKK